MLSPPCLPGSCWFTRRKWSYTLTLSFFVNRRGEEHYYPFVYYMVNYMMLPWWSPSVLWLPVAFLRSPTSHILTSDPGHQQTLPPPHHSSCSPDILCFWGQFPGNVRGCVCVRVLMCLNQQPVWHQQPPKIIIIQFQCHLLGTLMELSGWTLLHMHG